MAECSQTQLMKFNFEKRCGKQKEKRYYARFVQMQLIPVHKDEVFPRSVFQIQYS